MLGIHCDNHENNRALGRRPGSARQRQSKMLDSEFPFLARSLAFSSVAFLLIAKICWECGLEAFRHRLYVLEAELFELARTGRAATGEPACRMLRNSIRSMIRHSQGLGLFRHLATGVLIRRPVPAEAVGLHSQKWESAIARIGSDATRSELADLRERLLDAVGGFMTLGAVPLAAALSRTVSLGASIDRCRLFALRNGRWVEAQAGRDRRMPVSA